MDKEELREDKLCAMVDAVRLPSLLTDARGICLHMNDPFRVLCGHTDQDLVGHKPKEFLHGPATELDVHREVSKKLRTGLPFHFETTNYHRNGLPYTVFIFIAPLHDHRGEISHFFSLQFPTLDIGKGTRAQHRMLASEIERVFFAEKENETE